MPHLSERIRHLFSLIGKGSKWLWCEEYTRIIEQIKLELSNRPILEIFDRCKTTVLYTDASPVGLGAVLAQRDNNGDEHPIYYISRALTTAEVNYSQIEKEALAIVWAVKRLHQFLYLRRFEVVTDHRPLLKLFGPNEETPQMVASRLVRWAIILSGYTYTIRYIDTHKMPADFFSRAPCLAPAVHDVRFIREDVEHCIQVIQSVEALPISFATVKRFTQSDPVLLQLFNYCHNGWPNYKDAADDVKPYFKNRTALGITQDLVTWGHRIVLPARLRPQYLQELHAGHQGVVRTKALARAHVWWPGLGKEIEALVTSCAACAANGSCPALVEISPMPWPREPWSRLHLDLAGPFCGRNFLVLVDAHSKWMEVKLLKSTTSTAVIRKLESLFAYWGCPDVIVTDNGPQFISEEFGSFCSKYGTLNTTVSPYHPRSNGQAERAVATFKNFIRKLQHINDVKQELNKFLMHYRITPHSLTGQCSG